MFFDYVTCYDKNSSTQTTSGRENLDTVGIVEFDKYKILFHHNRLRNDVATQNTPEAGANLPPAKNMRMMYWSEDLAKKAQEWANNCDYKNSDWTFRTYNVNDLGTITVGENLYREWSLAGEDKDVVKQVSKWYSEIDFYVNQGHNVEEFKDSTVANDPIGHFT